MLKRFNSDTKQALNRCLSRAWAWEELQDGMRPWSSKYHGEDDRREKEGERRSEHCVHPHTLITEEEDIVMDSASNVYMFSQYKHGARDFTYLNTWPDDIWRWYKHQPCVMQLKVLNKLLPKLDMHFQYRQISRIIYTLNNLYA